MKEKPAAMDSYPNINSLISDFVVQLKTSGRSREVFEHVGPNHTEEEMFSYLWGLQEAHQALTPTLVSAGKSEKIAESFLEGGEEELDRGDLKEALKSCSMAILFAPHPLSLGGRDADLENGRDRNNNLDILITDEEEEDRSRAYRNFELLARGYGGRSEVLFEAGHYRQCIIDIDAALNHTSDDSLRERLHERRAKCHARLRDEEENGNISTKDKYEKLSVTLCSETPVLPDPHPTIPAFSKDVRVAFAPSQGRYLVAERDISPGKIYSPLNYCFLILFCCALLVPK